MTVQKIIEKAANVQSCERPDTTALAYYFKNYKEIRLFGNKT